jgi:hypothetical protein
MKVKLYKYTPHLESFIENPMLRCTPAHELNDPFELQPNENTVADFFESYTGSLGFDNAERYLQIRNGDSGVVSLSETKSNILMWSHYASEHKGGVIEFTFDVEYDSLQEMLQRGFINSIADNQYGFDRVKYRLEREPESDLFNSEGYELYQNLRKHLFFTKAEAWSYEKEYRFSCLLEAADNLCVPDSDKAKIELDKIGFQYKKADFNSDLLLISDCLDDPADKTIDLNKRIKRQMLTSNLKDAGISMFHFFNVKPSSVTGIYLGCKSSYKVKKETLNKFPNLDDRVYKAELCKHRYDIVFNRIA